MTSRLAQTLAAGRFVVTTELNPPKGTDLCAMLEKADLLKERVTAFNVTDCHAARMGMSPLAAAHLLVDRGAEPILQLTTRDRNRIALQGDMLGAAALGVSNLVFMGGDPPSNGDHPDAKPVFDVYASMLLEAGRAMERGVDMAGNALKGTPTFCLGAVVNPGADDLDAEIGRMHDKQEAGADFFQTQAVYDPRSFERFAARIDGTGARVLAGIILLKSPDMARHLNAHVPGIRVPDALVAELADAGDRARASLDIAARTIEAIRPACDGVHLMAIGWEHYLPDLLDTLGL